MDLTMWITMWIKLSKAKVSVNAWMRNVVFKFALFLILYFKIYSSIALPPCLSCNKVYSCITQIII